MTGARLGLSVLALVIAGCRQKPPNPAGLDCEPLAGASNLLAAGTTVFIGEIHGTRETPALVANLACQAAARGRSVTVGFEISNDEQPMFERYLASAGTPADRSALFESEFWRASYPDGRQSEALLHSLDRIRVLQRQGARIRLLLFDGALTEFPGLDSDGAMAQRILRERSQRPDDVLVLLAGNAHASKTGAAAGAHLVAAGLPFVALDLAYSHASAWCCMGTCARHELPAGTDRGRDPFVRIDPAVAGPNFDGIVYLNQVNASPPAVSRTGD